jgi:peptidoglycan/LPS O-acetylase OafA/YrhL
VTYRPHIDGLRAIAVLSVLGFHAGFRGFGGGFVGVDVFFVISGYLITGLLLRELEETGELSLRRFIERRVRRLAPALFVVLVATIAAGSVLLTPVGGEQQGLAKSAIATVLLCANVYFYQHTGSYFEPPPYSLPLLHTWSLSVEEQFYLVWPWLLLLVFAASRRFGRDANRLLVAVMVVVLLGSLAWCIHATGEDRAAAFYLTHFRAWEFAAGALAWLAMRASPAPSRVAGALAFAGLAAVLGSVFAFREALPFPGWIACLPVFGSAALIYGTESAPAGAVARALALRPLVLVGLISYSLYLWHWPVFTFAKALTLEEFTPALGIALSVLSIALAWATYRWIEHPIRTRTVALMASRPRAFGVGAALAATALLAALGLGVWAKLGWPRQPGNAELAERIAAIRHPDWDCDSRHACATRARRAIAPATRRDLPASCSGAIRTPASSSPCSSTWLPRRTPPSGSATSPRVRPPWVTRPWPIRSWDDSACPSTSACCATCRPTPRCIRSCWERAGSATPIPKTPTRNSPGPSSAPSAGWKPAACAW